MPTPLTSTPPLSPPGVHISGVAAIGAPILLLVSTVTFITDGNGINDGHVGGTIGVWAALAFIVAFIGIYRIVEPAAPRAAPILLTLAVLGWAAGVGFNIDAILAADFGREAVDTAAQETPFTLLAYLPWGWFAPISVVATGILLWRTRTFGRTSAALLVTAGVLFIVSRPARIEPLAVIADGVAILAFVPIGWSLLTGRRHPVVTAADTSTGPAAPANI